MPNVKKDDSERYHRLTAWRSFFTCTSHDHKLIDWNFEDAPQSATDRFSAESGSPQIVHNEPVSMRARRPDAPQYVGSVIVEKFTDLLFDENRRPQIVVDNGRDSAKEEYIRFLANEMDIFNKFIEIRDNGGSSSSAFAYIVVRNGIPSIRTVETRFCIPEFEDIESGSLNKVTIQYVYESTEIVTSDGKSEVKCIERWYKEEITKNEYIVYDNPVFKNGTDPVFNKVSSFHHGMNVFPGVWIFNRRRVDFDSIPDYYGAEQLIAKIDMMSSQLNRAGLYNGDPTMHIASDRQAPDARVGSFNTIETSANGKIALITIGEESVTAMRNIISEDISAVERLCKVDLSSFSGLVGRDRVTATEVSKMQNDMFAQASKLRGKYGAALVDLLYKAYLICRKLNKKIVSSYSVDTGLLSREFRVSNELSTDFNILPKEIKLKWGRYIDVSPAEMKLVIDAMSAAVSSGIIDTRTATQSISMYLPIHIDQEELVKRVENARKKKEASESKNSESTNEDTIDDVEE